MSRHHFSKWWWQDWENEQGLMLCSLAAQGLWMRLLCIAHAAEPMGYVLMNGKQPNTEVLAKLVRTRKDKVASLLQELEKHEVFSRTEQGVIYNRRMVRDAKKAAAGAAFAAKRWDKEEEEPNGGPSGGSNGSAGVNPKGDPKGNPLHKNHLSESESESARGIGSPHGGGPPPLSGGKPKFNLIFPGDPWPEPPVKRSAAASEPQRPLPPERTVEEQRAILEAMMREERERAEKSA